MKKGSKIVLNLVLMFTLLVSPIADGLFIPSAKASMVQGTITFKETIPQGYDFAGTAQMPWYHFQLWHHSGGFWSNQSEGIHISDDQMNILRTGQLSHPALDDWTFSRQIPLPSQVQAYLANGGQLSDIRMRFRADRNLQLDEIYKPNPQYTLTNNHITITAKPNFFVNKDAFYLNPNVNVTVAQPRANHGLVAFSIYTRSGQHLGTAYSGGSNPISPSDILNPQGHLTSGKTFDVTLPNGTMVTKDGSEIQIGYQTFAGGGAVGLHFYFPLIVEFYVPSAIDRIEVHYVDDQGIALLPIEEIVPENTGPYTVNAKTIPGYTLESPASGKHTVQIGKNQQKHQVTFVYTKDVEEEPDPAPDPSPPKITADLEIKPGPTMEFRDPFQLLPKDIDTGTCTYRSHRFRIERNGLIYTTSDITSKTSGRSFTYSTYPYVIGEGIHIVSIQVATYDCGTTDWLGAKTLEVLSVSLNRPPEFQVGWTRPGTFKDPVSRVVQGEVLDLVYLSEPAPTDPDGDTIYWLGFDFSTGSDWLRSIPSRYPEYTNGYHQIKMEELGYQIVRGTMRDQFGASTTRTAIVEVVPPNPIALPTCPEEVKSARTIPEGAFSSSESYSPLNRPIDHSKDEWTNRKTIYYNDTLENQTEKVYLHVYDQHGLKSLKPGECTITVTPDFPPVAKLDVPPLAIRGQTYDLWNQSYSEDGDEIVSAIYKYKYDAENNGFEDDEWILLDGTLEKTTFQPTQVGKYLFYLHVTEDYGRSDDTLDEPESVMMMDVINLPPEVSFSLQGKEPQPDFRLPVHFDAEDIMESWDLYETGSTKLMPHKDVHWSVEQGALVGGSGQLFQHQTFLFHKERFYSVDHKDAWALPFPDNGFGHNRLSPWRAATSIETSFPVFDTEQSSYGIVYYPDDNIGIALRANKRYFYFPSSRKYNDTSKRYYVNIHAMNKEKIGNVISQGGVFTWHFEYVDGSPIDFSIGPEDIPERTFIGHYYSCSSTCHLIDTYETKGIPHILTYEISDRTIYVLVEWYYNHERNRRQDGTRNYHTLVYDIASFDAFTGEYLGSLMDHGVTEFLKPNAQYSIYHNRKGFVDFRAVSKNDHLRIFVSRNVEHERVIEIDRYGRMVEDRNIPISIPIPSVHGKDGRVCTKKLNEPIFKGMYGDLYKYVYYECQYPGDSSSIRQYSSAVVKINPDLTLGWVTPLAGDEPFYYTCNRGTSTQRDANTVLLINSPKNQVIARSFTYLGGWDCGFFLEAIDMSTGEKTLIHTELNGRMNMRSTFTNFRVDWNGNWILAPVGQTYQDANATTTIEGYTTMYKHLDYARQNSSPVFDRNNQVIGYVGAGGTIGYATITNYQRFGEYFGDGLYVSLHTLKIMGEYNDGRLALWISKGPPTSEPALFHPFQLGQLMSKETVSNHELRFTLSMDDIAYDSEKVGFSFRMTDPMNRYALETDGHELILKKVVEGMSTELASSRFPFQDQTDYFFNIKMEQDRIQVFLNQVPYFDVTDATFASGKFGPFSDKAFVRFKDIHIKPLSEHHEWSEQYAVWEPEYEKAELRYEHISYDDPEEDPPAGAYEWHYTHEPRFIQNQGLSELHGKVFVAEQLELDKVGDYVVTMKAIDDPHPQHRHPSEVFQEYRKPSNAFTQRITVHRRPIAEFRLSVNEDYTVQWYDSSYDPDRWLNDSVYSTEETGIDYQATRGIMERKYMYVTPSGQVLEQQLTHLREPGLYHVYLAVKDEYGAWSPYTHRSLWSDCSDDCANEPPSVVVTQPASADVHHPTVFHTSRPQFRWNYADADGDPQTQFEVRIFNAAGHLVHQSGIISSQQTHWTPTVDLPAGTNLHVIVRANDGRAWSDFSAKKFFYINRPPVANFDWSPKTIWEGDPLQLIDLSSDPDGDPLTYVWTIQAPDGTVKTAHHAMPTISQAQQGMYQVTLTVSDGFLSHTVQRQIHVNELIIAPEVHHTPLWLAHHREKGHQTEEHPKDFYSGEMLIVQVTSSPVAVKEVTAWLDTWGKAGNRILIRTRLQAAGSSSTFFTGELHDLVLNSVTDGLPEGLEQVHFQILYENGTIKTASIPIHIIGNVNDRFGVHRRH